MIKNKFIIKIGGTLLDNKDVLSNIFQELVHYCSDPSFSIIIVHGGGCLVDNLIKKLKFPIEKKNGIRITPKNQINLIVGALSGTANKILLASAKKNNINGIGLCLSDGNTVKIKRTNNSLGYVGNASPYSPNFLNMLLKNDYTPIISSIGINYKGELINVNADEAATAIALTLNTNLIFLSDAESVLDAKNKPICQLTLDQANDLINRKIIKNGMVVKVNAAFHAANLLKNKGLIVGIAGWRYIKNLSIFSDKKFIGTKILV
ncbi:acetylglutamate kinase [Candidatus Tachikawaea gelatinosa]|uniref:Acetylglutamate kinase n=1 Tax=Candidatus Tachikawaea gelatinosa TaxID=1410383 RepID=A0A090AJE3_9ENTR|nr:acetylglutamate kinase [Candidatus Tachikawaea gelatinosa]BAP58563.1 acetylglutamate kinase [Candidatus Tachikawaea gelatinosa]